MNRDSEGNEEESFWKNELEKYFKKKSKRVFDKLDLSQLTDFPKISLDEIRIKITFGWFQINQALS